MKDRSDDPSHNERTFLPRGYISVPTVNEGSGVEDTVCNAINSYYQMVDLSYGLYFGREPVSQVFL